MWGREKRGPTGGPTLSTVGEPHPALPTCSGQRFGMHQVPVCPKRHNRDRMSPRRGHPEAGKQDRGHIPVQDPVRGGRGEPGDRPNPTLPPRRGASLGFHGDRLLFHSPHFSCGFPAPGAAALPDPGPTEGLRAQVSRGLGGDRGTSCSHWHPRGARMCCRLLPSSCWGLFGHPELPEEKPELEPASPPAGP